jgi:hypothetical protein
MISTQTVFYEVTLQVEPGLARLVEDHLRSHHIPAILATGCFEIIRFDQAAEGRFRTSYQARSPSELQHYLEHYSPGFRAEFQALFPTGITSTREIWSARELWQSG